MPREIYIYIQSDAKKGPTGIHILCLSLMLSRRLSLYSMRSVLIYSTRAGRPNADGNEMHRVDMEIDTCEKYKNYKKIDEPGHFSLRAQVSVTFEIVLKVVLEWNK